MVPVNLLLLALIVRASNVLLLGAFDYALRDYDSSSALLLATNPAADPEGAGRSVVLYKKLTVWDSIFFNRISSHGYEYEHSYAFFPLLPALLRLVERTVTWGNQEQRLLEAGLVISLLSFVCSAACLFELSKHILRDARLASIAVLFYCFSPASVFHTAFYTESLFAALTIGGQYVLYCTQNFWLSCLLFAASSATRSNGVINCGFILHASARTFITYFRTSKAMAAAAIAKAILGCAFVLSPFVAFQVAGHAQFCMSDAWRDSPRPWCSSWAPIPYSYVQSTYWGVGFLKYYQLKQIPNFLLAAPVLVLTAWGVVRYASNDLRFFLLGGLVPPGASAPQPSSTPQTTSGAAVAVGSIKKAGVRRRDAAAADDTHLQAPGATGPTGPPFQDPHVAASRGAAERLGYYQPEAAVFVFHWLFLAAVAATSMHVQVATRFLSSCPALYWWMAHLWRRRHADWLWFYCFAYMLIGGLLFVNFYPWT